MQQLNFKLAMFEGPLDLMLHLISKHKLDINDIPITVLLEQYISYIEEMQAADLDVASEFLTMAARLVYIKTVALLPSPEESEELKRELQGQLLEYQLAKDIAECMRQMCRYGLNFPRKPQELLIDKEYSRIHDKKELLAAYIMSLGKARRKLPPPQTAFTGIVSKRMVSVESRIVYLLKKLYTTGNVAYNEFFVSDDRSELVATFLAMLELIKSKRVTIDDENTYVTFRKDKILTEEELNAAVMEYEEDANYDDAVPTNSNNINVYENGDV